MAELTRADIERTIDTLEAAQLPSGLIEWVSGGQADPWNHLEATMALAVGGRRVAVERALEWYAAAQRPDGSLPLHYAAGVVSDSSGCTNGTAYAATALWHHWLTFGDEARLRELWPMLDRGLSWVCAQQLAWGGVSWSVDGRATNGALIAGSSSIYASLGHGVALAEVLGVERPEWLVARQHLGEALRTREERFLDKSEFSMDWYYPVLAGALDGEAAKARLAAKWDEFVMAGLGVRCVNTNPWMTGAETCELALSLVGVGDLEIARELFAAMQVLRRGAGDYWTGIVAPELVHWPVEQSSYTAAAVVLAWDALIGRGPASDVLTGRTWAPLAGNPR